MDATAVKNILTRRANHRHISRIADLLPLIDASKPTFSERGQQACSRVVPANAGTHTPEQSTQWLMFQQPFNTAFQSNGTAYRSLRSQGRHCNLAIRESIDHFPGQDGLRFSPNALRPSLASSVIASKAIWLSV